ncbi:MAG: AAA family ATPase [Desulfobacterales bacterium]|nr:AAA family ATPase [Desulfobacterales bacterium]
MECWNCLTENSETNKFCGECGCELSTIRKSPGVAFETEGERKQATVLFSDLSGYTAMTERLDPEKVKTIMGQIFGKASEIVEEYEGTVERFFGDEIMVLFGVPKAHEDDPVRAIYTALKIHKLVASLNPGFKKRHGIPLGMHTGINTGLMVTGEKYIGRDRYGLTGDTINLAKRLTSIAKESEIVVGPVTYRQSARYFSFQELAPTRVKGKTKLIEVHKVLSSKSYSKEQGKVSERRIQSAMVGRDKELNKLALQLAKVIDGDGSVVNIIGEAGIGKSRLLAEFKKLDALNRVDLIEGKAISIGKNLAFHPIIDLLKRWAQIGENDSEVIALSKLELVVKSVPGVEPSEIIPFIAILMGMKLIGRYAERVENIEGEALEKLILKNVRDLFSKASELKPLVIVTEDLHWADSSSLELLESLFRLAESQGILFINVFRPDHPETGGRIIQNLKDRPFIYQVAIVLKPLDERISERMISNMLNIEGLSFTVKNKIIERAGGNPFFIEEVVRSFIDEGAIVKKEGRFEITDRIDSMDIPYTINDVLAARIDRLEDGTRNLVKNASVIGRNFFRKILLEVSRTVPDIDDRLNYLQEIQFIQDRKRLDEIEYLFKHVLAQEAAYGLILHQKRKKLHFEVARAIERAFNERLHEFFGVLALHYSRAEEWVQAEFYLARAGEEALRSSASSEALHYYQEASNLYLKVSDARTDTGKQAMFDKNIALALYNRGQYDEAVEYFEKALNFYWGRLPQNAWSKPYRVLSALLHFMTALYCPFLKFRRTATREDVQTLDLFYKKSKALSIINPLSFFIESIYICKEVTRYNLSTFELGLKIYVASSSLFSFTGVSFRLSRKILDSAKQKIQKGQVKIYIIYDFMETIHNYLSGNWRNIGSHDSELINKNLKAGEIYLPSQYLYWHGCHSIYGGDQERTQTILDALSDIAKVYENDFSILLNYMLKIKFLMEHRHLNEALTEIERGLEFAKIKGFTITLLDFYSCQARIFIFMQAADRAAQSIALADEVRASVRAAPIQLSIFYRSQLEYLLFKLETALDIGDAAGAAEHSTRAGQAGKMLIRAAKKAAQHRSEAYKLQGVYYWLIKKPELAFKWLNKAIAEGERLGARLELSRIYFEIGKRIMESSSRFNSHNGLTAGEYLNKANSLFVDMGLEWELDRLKLLDRQ